MPPPDRWDAYQALGSVIPETRIFACKVPLKEEISRSVPESERFSPDLLIQRIKESGKRLGLVVDLTFTRKYYNGQDFVKQDIQYEKIFTQGHEVPSDDIVQRFYQVIDDFNSKNSEEEDLIIGVHCTHGVNRTGYLVCRYMIERLNMDPDKAITLFGEARGHPIERENYLKHLQSLPLKGTGMTSSPVKNESYNSDSANWRQGHHRNFASEKWSGGPQRNGRNTRNARGGFSDRRQDYSSYSSPLEQFDTQEQNGWGNAARSGWHSSRGFQQNRRGHESRGNFHHQHDSWRRRDGPYSPENKNNGPRDKYQSTHNSRGSYQDFRDCSRVNRGGNWRHGQMNNGFNQQGFEQGWGGFRGNQNSYSRERYSGQGDRGSMRGQRWHRGRGSSSGWWDQPQNGPRGEWTS